MKNMEMGTMEMEWKKKTKPWKKIKNLKKNKKKKFQVNFFLFAKKIKKLFFYKQLSFSLTIITRPL